MQKILGEQFAERCRKLLAIEGQNMHSVARKLGVSQSTVYRATGGKRRTVELAKSNQRKWAETTRKGRTKSGARRNVGHSKATFAAARRKRLGDGRKKRHSRKRVLAGTI